MAEIAGKYLVTNEDGESWTQRAISCDDMKMFESGVIDIIDMTTRRRLTMKDSSTFAWEMLEILGYNSSANDEGIKFPIMEELDEPNV